MVNKVILIGNVGKDPEIRYFDNDQAVANFTLATTERGFKTRDGQDVPERTEWHNVVAWRGLAKVVESYVKKGTQLYVEGKLRTRTYDDTNGVKRYVTEIVADSLNLLGRRPLGDGESAPMTQAAAAPVPPKQPVQNSGNESPFLSGDNGPEDDLPF
ncbi:single-stranded DNA-binding protein [Alkaliflexus imshenetskii]|uniref:single-stranded DNA-binding protein n=1 Tax=Alkaliflexus imshenetskii TaxID=286730 RepID=UPI0004B97446|nr:single-stranded DNA-binding protein [Alkaliflexus imshenetskii]